MGDQPVIELKGVTFGYSANGINKPALEDVDLAVPALDFLGVIGPNGGGKTTLLKIILGLLRPQCGEVRLLGEPPTKSRHRVGYVPQHTKIDTKVPASVLDVVLMGRLSRSSWGPKFGRAEFNAARRALEQTGTIDLADRPIGELSGGQRQRVLIARALASDAEVLLLDEPIAGVDAHAERGLTDHLHNLNRDIPIVMVSHDIGFVSNHLKTVACLSTRLQVHHAGELTDQLIAGMYHGEGHALHHGEHCPIGQPAGEQQGGDGCQSEGGK